MFKLLKGGYCYTPFDIGQKDILVACGMICRMEEHIEASGLWDVQTYDCTGRIICPGFIDQHVHITGGGGEEGPASRIPELQISDAAAAGVTTLVGVLGVDDVTRNIAGLLAKAQALEIEGITSYIYTGSYGIPTATLTGRVITDIAYIDKVIGVGEIAISDYRSSHPTVQDLKALAYEAKVGGMVSGKAGIVHIHTGDGKQGISLLTRMQEESDFPVDMFVPTHLNRNKKIFEQAESYARMGGNVDLTAGESSEIGYSIPDALEILLKSGVSMERITLSSDGNGSRPAATGSGGVGKVAQLYEDIKSCIASRKMDIPTVLKTVTLNVAKVLKLYPKKGLLAIGSDADILVLDRDTMGIDIMFAKGEVFVQDGKILRKGRYQQ